MQSSHPSDKVAVIGGGLAGIAAAAALAREGIPVTLFEARSKLGGRAGSFSTTDGELVDYCQHVSMRCCTNFRQLMHWLHLESEWQEVSTIHALGGHTLGGQTLGGQTLGGHGKSRRLAAWTHLPTPLHLLPWLARWPGLGILDRYRIARCLLLLKKLPADSALESVSAESWLIAKRQSPRAKHNFWQTIAVSALGETLARVSMAAVAKVMVDGFLSHRLAHRILLPRKPLSILFDELTRNQLLEMGVELRTGCTIRGVRLVNGEVIVELAGGPERFASAVLAVPWHQVPRMISDLDGCESLLNSLTRLESSAIAGIHTWWDSAWCNLPHAMFTGGQCQWIFRAPYGSRHAGHYVQIVISASQYVPATDRDDLESLIRRELEPHFPELKQSRLLRLQMVEDRNAVFAPMPNARGLRPSTEALGPRLKLAGDWTDTSWPATMESAVRSGFLAAESLLKEAQRPRRLLAAPLS